MTKSDLVERIAEKLDVTKKEAEAIVNVVFGSIVDAVKREEKVELRGFGCFKVKTKRARKGRNPRTGEEIDIPPKRVPYFKPGKDMKEAVNRE
ncbi:MAG TPA: HU family DNA-binding protein [Thermosulfidibacter takaii]|uniref:HU family DNA-binding protein n=1 Tax=Thermosulfidibacter takaii TaxID=412593 RepID=A0A7C0U5D6_9BACT|nr:HU family DNA-binding protein [Thermosulfidibacter takaii]